MNFWLEVLKLLIPALVSIAVIYVARWLERKKEIEQELRQKKKEAYNSIIVTIYKSIHPDLESPTIENLACLNKDLIIWSSEEVIKKYLKFRENRDEKDFGDLLFEIRKDTGHEDKKLKPKNLLEIIMMPNEDKSS
ncbi:MAG: hypothetical protein V2B14_01440 [bacterium]